MNFRKSQKRRPEANLDMTPLIDVVFLLLIFFLITTTFSRPTQTQQEASQEVIEEAKSVLKVFQIMLAEASAGSKKSPVETLSVYINADNELILDNGEKTSLNALKEMLLRLKAEDKLPPVDVNADQRIPYGSVVEILNVIVETGVENVQFVIEQPGGE